MQDARRNTPGCGSPAIASAVRLWPSSTATSPNKSPEPMKFSVNRLPSEAPVSIRVRMGLHTGLAEYRDHDYFGPALNRVA